MEQAHALADFDFDTPNPVVSYRRVECTPTDSDSKSVTESGFREVTPPAENEYPYRPCPANVVFPDGHHECLG
jgi:hypothetical protein